MPERAIDRLNQRHRDFVCALPTTNWNLTEAARIAGYAETTAAHQANRLLGLVGIQEAIAEMQEERSQEYDITERYIIERLKMEAELYGEGSSHSARVKAIELLGKQIGMFQEKRAKEPEPFDLSAIPDDTLIEIHEQIRTVTVHRQNQDGDVPAISD